VRVYFDTNVVLAAFATRGLCADLFAHVLLEHELLVGADALVTGDAALHKLGKRAPLPIVTPRGLWDLLRGAEPDR
jgi:predicted nucleic acid-binding protein